MKSRKLKDVAADGKPGATVEGDDQSQRVTYLSDSPVVTVEDAIKKAQIDTDIWEVERFLVNSWQQGSSFEGQVSIADLWQVKLWIKRKVPKFIEQTIKGLVKDWKPRPLPKVKHKGGVHLAELSCYDIHFQKAAYNNQSIRIEEQIEAFLDATFRAIDTMRSFDVGRIHFPIGNDAFQVDNWDRTTTKGTVVSVTDDLCSDVFTLVWECMEAVIRRLMKVAPVEVIWVPGNHDRKTSFYLCELLRARFLGTKHVNFDLSIRSHKFHTFGQNLFGYAHGDLCKPRDVNDLMMNSVPELVGKTKYRFWRTGHLHTKRTTRAIIGDTYKGTRHDIMPSMSVTDRWHFDNGFVGNIPACELWLFHRECGYKGQFSEEVFWE